MTIDEIRSLTPEARIHGWLVAQAAIVAEVGLHHLSETAIEAISLYEARDLWWAAMNEEERGFAFYRAAMCQGGWPESSVQNVFDL